MFVEVLWKAEQDEGSNPSISTINILVSIRAQENRVMANSTLSVCLPWG
jgi:hypothetical protein